MCSKFASPLFVCVLVLASTVFAGHAGDDFKRLPPFFYAAIAEASYEGSKGAAQKTLNKILGEGKATVRGLKDHKSVVYGSSHFLLVKDEFGGMHIAIEGSNSVRNWIANANMPIRGTVSEYDVPAGIRDSMNDIYDKWKNKHGRIITIVGHSQGGMYASQLKAASKNRYKHTVAITFNGFKIKKKIKDDQYHLAIKTEHAATLCSPSGRYIKLPMGSAHWKIVSNHGMGYFLNGLENKSWDAIL